MKTSQWKPIVWFILGLAYGWIIRDNQHDTISTGMPIPSHYPTREEYLATHREPDAD